MVFLHLAHRLYDIEYLQFCGNTIAGISLLSSAVMRLVHTDNKELFADALIKRRSLYIMRYSKTCLKQPLKKTKNWFLRPNIA